MKAPAFRQWASCRLAGFFLQWRATIGFIAPDDGTGDVFVHHSAIDMGGYRSLTENQRVEYTTRQGPKGLQADQVRSL